MPKKNPEALPVSRSEFFHETKLLRDQFGHLAMKFISYENRLQFVEENMITKDAEQRILSRFDSIAEWIVTSKDKEPVQDHRLTELESKTGNHETRIARLETSRP